MGPALLEEYRGRLRALILLQRLLGSSVLYQSKVNPESYSEALEINTHGWGDSPNDF